MLTGIVWYRGWERYGIWGFCLLLLGNGLLSLTLIFRNAWLLALVVVLINPGWLFFRVYAVICWNGDLESGGHRRLYLNMFGQIMIDLSVMCRGIYPLVCPSISSFV